MPTAQLAHVMVFAKDLAGVVDFYSHVFGWTSQPTSDPGYVELQGAQGIQLAVHALPPEIAAGITVATPAGWREEVAIKACFVTDDLTAVRDRVLAHGGQAKTPWTWNGGVYCECADPEGNVVQLLERPASS